MRIVMVGAGYVGLVSGACLADFGHEVVCVEVDESKVLGLREGRVPIYEPGLSELVLANQAGGPAFVHDQPERGGAWGAGDLHRRRHTFARGGSARPTCAFVHDAAREIGEIIDGLHRRCG